MIDDKYESDRDLKVPACSIFSSPHDKLREKGLISVKSWNIHDGMDKIEGPKTNDAEFCNVLNG